VIHQGDPADRTAIVRQFLGHVGCDARRDRLTGGDRGVAETLLAKGGIHPPNGHAASRIAFFFSTEPRFAAGRCRLLFGSFLGAARWKSGLMAAAAARVAIRDAAAARSHWCVGRRLAACDDRQTKCPHELAEQGQANGRDPNAGRRHGAHSRVGIRHGEL
jgi:hypothetical protein